jgi:DUF1680 family protein
LEAKVDHYIELMEKAQAKDGYLNSYYLTTAPRERWTDLRVMHELYGAGHLMEAAVAYSQATGKRKMLDIMCRYADHIDRTFGPKKGQKRGYPGHEEIELALVKLYRTTRNQKYLALAKYFIDERGRLPHYFTLEAKKRGEPNPAPSGFRYQQAHLPVRQQKTADGHAVRAVYLYAGMADVAAETNDQQLLAACRTLWRNIEEKRMYITGGIGSTAKGEAFTFDYDLPNETAYAETCAAIGLVFFAQRMLNIDKDRRYADVMERALYNGVLSGVSLDGKRFFYGNPLTVFPEAKKLAGDNTAAFRQKWFGCACCPPNIARMLASLGSYIYSTSNRTIHTHLYIGGSADLKFGNNPVHLTQITDYPWSGSVSIMVKPEKPVSFTLALRLPAWCQNPRVSVNGKSIVLAKITKKGYAHITRKWNSGDVVDLTLPMSVERIYSHSSVRMNAGKVALRHGPLVYCLEEKDNGPGLAQITLPTDSKLNAKRSSLFGGSVTITGNALRIKGPANNDPLYSRNKPATKKVKLTAIPYCLWNNRGNGEMLVWINER